MISKNEKNQISFDAHDIVAAFRDGEAEFVFLKTEPDEFGRTLCAKKWDDQFTTREKWFFCLGFNTSGRTDIDQIIAERALKNAQFKAFDQMYEGF